MSVKGPALAAERRVFLKRASGLLVAASLTVAACFSQERYTVTRELAKGPGSPEIIVLRDNLVGVEAAIAPSQGGELSSYRVRFRGEWVELLFHARDYSPGPGFKGKAPLLWPAVGAQYSVGTNPKTSCGDGTYPIAGKVYPMPCHGFARSMPWTIAGSSADKTGARAIVELRDSPATRVSYPFAFSVQAAFELAAGHISINYTVTSGAANTAPMPFAIGNHIAFNIPFLAGSKAEDMTFVTPSTVQLLRNDKGVLSGEEQPRSFDNPTRLGDFNALVAMPLAGYKSQPFVLLNDPQGLSLRIAQQASSIEAEPLVRFNVFGGPKAGYFSPEPWFGTQNSLNTGKGRVQLAAGKSWNWRIELQADGAAPEAAIPSPGVEKVAGGFGFVEGPVWSRDGYLVFSDIYNSRIQKLTPGKPAEILRNHSLAANGNAMDIEGRLYTAERDGRRIVRMAKDGKLTVLASTWQGKRLNSPNDLVVRKDGHVYFTDPASKAVLEAQELGFNGVYHISPSGKLSLITPKLDRPNGITLTPDGKTLYVADSAARKIFAFDLDDAGNASNQREFISSVDGAPDGLRVAANGNVYTSCRGICVYSPAAKLLRVIEFPEAPANCAFGGEDLQTLYVTARTSVYRVRIPDKGALLY